MIKTKALLTIASLFLINLSVVGNVAQAETKTPRPTENICVANDIYVSCDLLEDCLLSDGEIGTLDGEPVCWEDTAVKKRAKLKGVNNSLSGQKAVGTTPQSTSPVTLKKKPLLGQSSGTVKAVQ